MILGRFVDIAGEVAYGSVVAAVCGTTCGEALTFGRSSFGGFATF